MSGFLSLRAHEDGSVILVPVSAIVAPVFEVVPGCTAVSMTADVSVPAVLVRETPTQIANQLREIGIKVAKSPLGPPPEQLDTLSPSAQKD